MNLKPGVFFHSLPSLDETDFEKSVIFIAEHNDKGALGFVVNKIFSKKLNDLVEFRNSPAFPLYEGGPMGNEHLYFLHRRPELIAGGEPVSGSTYLGGNFKKAVELLNNRAMSEADMKIFIGYCGWDSGQLEAEIEEGSWWVSENDEIFL